MRRVLATAIAVTSVAFAAMPSACKPTICTLLACDAVHARITAHVKAPLADLVAAKTTVCWREVCADLTAASDAGTSSEIAFDTRASLLVGEATVSAEGEGASRLQLDLRFFTRARNGDLVYTRAENGDRYRVTVVAADGKQLFAAERIVTYDDYYPNGTDCDPEPCHRVMFDL